MNYIKTELIENYIKDNNINKGIFCAVCGISQGVLNKILTGKTNFRYEALFKIARLLNIRIRDLCYPVIGQEKKSD